MALEQDVPHLLFNADVVHEVFPRAVRQAHEEAPILSLQRTGCS